MNFPKYFALIFSILFISLNHSLVQSQDTEHIQIMSQTVETHDLSSGDANASQFYICLQDGAQAHAYFPPIPGAMNRIELGAWSRFEAANNGQSIQLMHTQDQNGANIIIARNFRLSNPNGPITHIQSSNGTDIYLAKNPNDCRVIKENFPYYSTETFNLENPAQVAIQLSPRSSSESNLRIQTTSFKGLPRIISLSQAFQLETNNNGREQLRLCHESNTKLYYTLIDRGGDTKVVSYRAGTDLIPNIQAKRPLGFQIAQFKNAYNSYYYYLELDHSTMLHEGEIHQIRQIRANNSDVYLIPADQTCHSYNRQNPYLVYEFFKSSGTAENIDLLHSSIQAENRTEDECVGYQDTVYPFITDESVVPVISADSKVFICIDSRQGAVLDLGNLGEDNSDIELNNNRNFSLNINMAEQSLSLVNLGGDEISLINILYSANSGGAQAAHSLTSQDESKFFWTLDANDCIKSEAVDSCTRQIPRTLLIDRERLINGSLQLQIVRMINQSDIPIAIPGPEEEPEPPQVDDLGAGPSASGGGCQINTSNKNSHPLSHLALFILFIGLVGGLRKLHRSSPILR